MLANFLLAPLLLMAQPADLDFQVKVKKPADRVVAVKEKQRTVLLVTSPSGIGQATLTLKAGQWPDNVTLRFEHDKGKGFASLESLKLTTDRLRIEGSKRVSGRFLFAFLDAKRKPIALESGKNAAAGEMNVVVDAKNGAIEVTLPASLLIGSSQLEVAWIDAFR
jgi:hypothetical protein